MSEISETRRRCMQIAVSGQLKGDALPNADLIYKWIMTTSGTVEDALEALTIALAGRSARGQYTPFSNADELTANAGQILAWLTKE